MTSTAREQDLGRFGVFGSPVGPTEAKAIEALGYGTLWVGGSPAPDLRWAEPILQSTVTLQVAAGIVNIWSAKAVYVAQAFHRIDAAHPGRFLLGIGVGHPETNQPYRKPLDALNDYLDELDRYGVPEERRVVAAVGPRMLRLAAERSAGAHPYLTTPEHTREAREIVGAARLLAPEHKVVVNANRQQARAVARERLAMYLRLDNALTNFARLGFTDEDVEPPGSDRLVDSMVAHGAPDDVATAVTRHLDSGANHVPLQVLTQPQNLIYVLTQLAGPLGLR